MKITKKSVESSYSPPLFSYFPQIQTGSSLWKLNRKTGKGVHLSDNYVIGYDLQFTAISRTIWSYTVWYISRYDSWVRCMNLPREASQRLNNRSGFFAEKKSPETLINLIRIISPFLFVKVTFLSAENRKLFKIAKYIGSSGSEGFSRSSTETWYITVVLEAPNKSRTPAGT